MALPEAAGTKAVARMSRRLDREIRLFMASSPWGIERLVGSRSLVKTLSNESNDLGKPFSPVRRQRTLAVHDAVGAVDQGTSKGLTTSRHRSSWRA